MLQSAALLAAIREYEASKWKVIGQKVGKPAKVGSKSRQHVPKLIVNRLASNTQGNILAAGFDKVIGAAATAAVSRRVLFRSRGDLWHLKEFGRTTRLVTQAVSWLPVCMGPTLNLLYSLFPSEHLFRGLSVSALLFKQYCIAVSWKLVDRLLHKY